MNSKNELMRLVQSFFQEYLSSHRGLSPNTIMAYRDALKLFLQFVSSHKRKNAAKLTLDDLTAEIALLFLKQIEDQRKNSTITRNLRLAALKTFGLYLVSKDPLRAWQYQRIIAIPLKRAPRRVIGYLEVDEVKTILDTIDRTVASGHRDYVLLSLLYNTGARVQEICDMKVNSLRLGSPPIATIVGKGRKTRHVPLWPETAKMLEEYVARAHLSPESALFLNARREPLGRFGIRHIIQQRWKAAAMNCPSLKEKKISPHTFRHTTAMHLLQAGIDLTVIKSWLGHVNLSTTHAYIEINMEMKRKALSACNPIGKAQGLKDLVDRNKDVLAWLESL